MGQVQALLQAACLWTEPLQRALRAQWLRPRTQATPPLLSSLQSGLLQSVSHDGLVRLKISLADGTQPLNMVSDQSTLENITAHWA